MLPDKLNKESAMSDPVSNAEIEDVLSSIRRLVSENAGAARRVDPQAMPEKLVLTPAFRIDEGEDQTESPRGQDGEVVTFDGAGRTVGEPVDEAVIEEAVAAVVEDDAPEAVDARPEQDEAVVVPDAPEQAGEGHKSALESRIAELESVIARSASEFEPDGSEEELALGRAMFRDGHEAENAEAESQDLSEAPERSVAPDAPGAEETAHEEGQATDDQPADAWQMADPTAKPAKNAGAAFRTIEDAFDTPDDPHADAEGLAADAWEDVETDDATDDDDDAGAVLDEEAVRDMVARMVREELQGSVGERITHNVRRMVRREIARALALKDFE